jgi:hypothetical protein
MTLDEQLSFDAQHLAHRADPPSAHAAAQLRGKETHRRACLAAHLADPSGLTDDEVAQRTGIELHEARRRCSDLRNLGLIAWQRNSSGRVVTRTNPAGNPSSVSEPAQP